MTARTSGSSRSARADLHDVRRRPGHGRQVHHRLRRSAAEVVDQDVLDDADDGVPLVGVAGGGADLLADRILAREQHRRRRLADDHVGRALFFLDPVEVTAATQLDPHRLEVRAAGAREANERRFGAARHDGGRGDVLAAGALIQRKRGDVADGFDAGDGLQAIHERVLEPRHRGPVVQVGAAGGDLKREDVFRVVPGVDVTELPEAAHEQRRSDQQDERRRGLHDHQRVARQSPAADDASSGLLKAAQARARDAEGGPQPERARRQHREAGGEDQRDRVQACRRESGNGRAAKTAGDRIRRGTDQERDARPTR